MSSNLIVNNIEVGAGATIYTAASNQLAFGTNGSERLRINASGRVAIGNNPTVHADYILHVEDSGETNIKVEGSTSTLGARLSLQNNDTTANAYNQYAFNDAGGQSTSAIRGINTDQTNNYGELAFLTRNAQGTPPAERMRITKDGQLIHKSDKASGYIAEFHQDHTSNSAQILIDSPTDNNLRPTSINLANAGTVKWSLGQAYSSASSGAFHIATSSLSSNENGAKLTITTAGKVGIGTINPSQKVSIAAGRVNIDVNNDHYGVWADGSTTGENHISVGRWYNTGGGLKSGYSQYGINNLILENNHATANHCLIIQPNGQKVAIGTHVTDGLVHIGQLTAGSVNADADADELVLESSDKTGMSILSPGSGESSIYFGNPGTNGQKEAWLKYYHETHSNNAKQRALQIKVAGGECAYFNSTGLVMANDKGLSFINADDTATGETVQGSVLDDYEYGSWVPTYTSSNATFGYTTQEGWYVKVGKLVTVRAYIRTSSVSSTSHSLLKMSGLPFQVAYRTPCSVRAWGFQSSGYDVFPTVATFEHNQTYLEFLRYTSGGTSDYTTSTMNNVTNVVIAGSYKVD